MTEMNLNFKVPLSKKVISLIMIVFIEICINVIYTIAVYVGPLSELHGWSPNLIVLTYTVCMFMEPPAYLIGGWMMNVMGVRKAQVLAGIIYGLAITMSGLTSNVYVFIVCQGVMCGLTLIIVYLCNIARINALFRGNKGLAMGIMYGASGVGGVFMAPLLAYFFQIATVSTVLVWEGIIFAAVLVFATLMIYDPTKGNKELQAKIQEEADAEEVAEAIAGKGENALPTMRWKKALTHPGIWCLFLCIISIQMIGNVLVSDIAILSETVYKISEMDSAWVVSGFSAGAAIGAVLVGAIADKLGPYKTTFILGMFNGVLLLLFAVFGTKSFMAFAILCIIQGATYNGITTLNPVMITDSYSVKDMGVMLALMGLSFGVVALIGPQLGLSLPFVPMLIVCAVFSIIGGFLAKAACGTINKYYRKEGSECVVK